jgi:hypothetical protein
MHDCPIRKQLLGEWCDAVNDLSLCVDLLEACPINSAMFLEQRRFVELAEVAAENARVGLNQHSSGHRCEGSNNDTAACVDRLIAAVSQLETSASAVEGSKRER